MKTIEEIKSILIRHKPTLSKRFKVKELGLFGSYVRNEQSQQSDIDILVELSEPISGFMFLDLEEYLSEILGIKVDLVSKKALKPQIGKMIIRETIDL